MTLLSFLGFNLWKDVREIKDKWITRDEFNQGLEKSNAERDKKHLENTGNFRRVEEKIERSDARNSDSAIAIEKRIGDVLVKIAEIRPPQRKDGPERRRY